MANENTLVLSTKQASLHPPIFIEIDGIKYQVTYNKRIFERFFEMEAEAEKDPKKAITFIYDEICEMTGAPPEVVEKLDIRDARQVMQFLAQRYTLTASSVALGEGEEKAKDPITPGDQKNG